MASCVVAGPLMNRAAAVSMWHGPFANWGARRWPCFRLAARPVTIWPACWTTITWNCRRDDGRTGNAHSWISHEPGRGWVQLEFPNPARIDRIVWIYAGQQLVAADIIDFKTDVAEDDLAVNKKREYYRPQLESYRDAVCRMSGLTAERVITRLVFVGRGLVVQVA